MRFSICCRCNAEERSIKATADGGNGGFPVTIISPVTTQPKSSETIQLDRITEVSGESSSVQAVKKEEESPPSTPTPSSSATHCIPPVRHDKLNEPQDDSPTAVPISVNCTTNDDERSVSEEIDGAYRPDRRIDMLAAAQQNPPIKPLTNISQRIGSDTLNLDMFQLGYFHGTFKGKQFSIENGKMRSQDGDYDTLEKEQIMSTYSQAMEGLQRGIKKMEGGIAQFGLSASYRPSDSLQPETPIHINFTNRYGEKAVILLTMIKPGHFRGRYEGKEFTILNGKVTIDGASDEVDEQLIFSNYSMAMLGMKQGLMGMQNALQRTSTSPANCNTALEANAANSANVFNATNDDPLSTMRKLIQEKIEDPNAAAELIRKLDAIKRAQNFQRNAVDEVDANELSEPVLQKTTFEPNAILYEDPKTYEELDKDEIPPAKRLDEYIISLDESVAAGNRYYFHAAKPRRVTKKELTPKEHFQIASLERYSLFESECLKAHNHYRKLHGVPPLVHSDFLSQVAKEWAEHLALKDAFYHRPKNDYGENLYRAEELSVHADKAVTDWYDEIDLYDYNKPSFSKETGHFTQLVWKDTREMGTGVAQLGKKIWVCCNYHPRGNYSDEFNDEFVPRPLYKRVPKI